MIDEGHKYSVKYSYAVHKVITLTHSDTNQWCANPNPNSSHFGLDFDWIRIQTLKSWIRIRSQEKMGEFGFRFESGFELLVADHKLLDSDSDLDSRKLRWIQIRVDSDSRQVDSDSASRSLDSHISDVLIRIRIQSSLLVSDTQQFQVQLSLCLPQ